jgi:hypothetical protein
LINASGYISDPNNESNYSPLIFVNGKLSGWGWGQLSTTASRYEFIVKRR